MLNVARAIWDEISILKYLFILFLRPPARLQFQVVAGLDENKSPYLVAAIFGGGRAQPILSWQHLVTSAQVPTHFLHFIFTLLPQREPDFNACALRTLLSIGLALDFHRAPRQNVSVQSFLPPATSVIVSRVVICFKRGNIWDVLNFHLPGPKCIDAQSSLKEQSLWKKVLMMI